MSDNPPDRILAKLDALEAGQTQFRVELMGRMNRLGDDIGSICDDIGVNMGRADRAIEAADHPREELRALGREIAAMWRKMNRLEGDVRDLRGTP